MCVNICTVWRQNGASTENRNWVEKFSEMVEMFSKMNQSVRIPQVTKALWHTSCKCFAGELSVPPTLSALDLSLNKSSLKSLLCIKIQKKKTPLKKNEAVVIERQQFE